MTDDTHGITDDRDGSSYGLIISFAGLHKTDAEEIAFVHGVEFGGIYGRMNSDNENEIEETVHAANRIAFERAAAAMGWDVTFEATTPPTDEWLEMSAKKVRPARRNPNGLRVVT
ncbi:MAG: hypothetical protein AAFV45_08780 [Pseudomonadota bacterium]